MQSAIRDERLRRLRFRQSAAVLIVLIALQAVTGVFGAYELSKGASFHRFNQLHVSYDMILGAALEAMAPPLSTPERTELERLVRLIRAQPVACLETAAWYDRIFIRFVGTGRALDLCAIDIEVADRALAALEAARTGRMAETELLEVLRSSALRFHAHSEEFEPLVDRTVRLIYGTVLTILLLLGGIVLGVGGHLILGMDQAFAGVEELRRAADEASHTKSQFLANMSHEIRTPLNGVLGNLELAAGLTNDAELGEHIGVAARSADGLLALINDILDISKVEANKLDLEDIPFDVEALVSDIDRLYRARASQKMIALSTQVDLTSPVRRGDPTRIRQILSNLVSNALKFTPADGSIAIEVRESSSDEIDLIVSDTGVGIPPAKQKSVFRSFEQADTSTTRRFGGTGLGLTIVDRLVRLMGGSLELDSELGRGSRFLIRVPLPLSVSTEIRDPGPAPEEDVGSLRILVVDDIETNRRIAQKMLERMGHEVVMANDGEEAIQVFTSSPSTFDLILMDIQMPVLDGVAATRRLRHHYGGDLPPVVALTAHAMSSDRDKYLKEGMDGYLTKPVRQADLRRIVAEHGRRGVRPRAM